MSGQKSGDHLTDQSMASVHLQERREVRFDVAIEIEVSGIDQNGQAFHERTLTRDVSKWGCGFVVSTELRVDDMVALRRAPSGGDGVDSCPQSLFQVLRVKREGAGWLVGVWKMDNGDVWGTELPKASQSQSLGQEARKQEPATDEPNRRKDADR